MAPQKPITPLIPSVVSKLRSGCQVSCFPQAVEEVVSNSLDANSSVISVFIDPKEYSFRVEDDGCGVPAAQFGYLCQPHCTSKIRKAEELNDVPVSFGFRGEALACIAQMSLVHITSRAYGSFESMSKVVRGGEVLKCGVSMTTRAEYGTEVFVRNFMFNQPVRQKQAINSKHKRKKELCQIQNNLFQMLLPFPHVELIVHICGKTDPVLHLLQDRTRDWSLQSMFSADVKHLVPVSSTDGLFSIEGNVLLPFSGHHSREKQFLFVNGRPVYSLELSGMMKAMLQFARTQSPEKTYIYIDCTKHPGCFLNISAPRTSYCVGYEAGRATVLFQSDQKVFALAQRAIMEAWGCESPINRTIGEENQGLRSQKERFHVLTSGSLEPRIWNNAMIEQKHKDPSLGENSRKILLDNVGKDCVSSYHKRILATTVESKKRRFKPTYVSKHLDIPENDAVEDSKNKISRLGELQSSLVHNIDSDHSYQPSLCFLHKLPVAERKSHSKNTNKHDRKRLKTFSYDRGKNGTLQLKVKGCIAEVQNQGKKYARQGYDIMLTDPEHDQFSTKQTETLCDLSGEKGLSCKYSLSLEETEGGSRYERSIETDFRQPFVEDSSIMFGSIDSLNEFSSSEHILCYDPAHTTCLEQCDEGIKQSKTFQHRQGLKLDEGALRQKQQDSIDYAKSKRETDSGSPLPKEMSPQSGHTPCRQGPQRALSAPPHQRQCHRGYHSNPIKSLKTFENDLGGDVLCARSASGIRQSQRGAFRGVQSMLSRKKEKANIEKRYSYSLPVGDSATTQNSSVAHDKAESYEADIGLDKSNITGATPKFRHSSIKRVQFAVNSDGISDGVKCGKQGFVDLSSTGVEEQSNKMLNLQESFGMDDSDAEDGIINENQALGLKNILKHFQNPCIGPQGNFLDNIAKIEEFGPVQTLIPSGISRAVFKDTRILSQIGRKFIVMVCGGVLVAVDQHAADERVRMEMLQNDLLNTGERFGMLKSQLMNSPQWLHLTHFEQQVFQTYEHKVKSWGWKGELDLETSKLKLTHLPVLFGSCLNATELKIYLHHLEDTSGSDILPPCVVRVLKSKACRSAIMFGDELCDSECSKLIQSLKNTKFCFSCAHGRPTMAPLANIVCYKAAARAKRFSAGVKKVPRKELSIASLNRVLSTS